MHIVKLNMSDEVFGKFLDFLETLPNESVGIEEIDGTTFFPSVNVLEAKNQMLRESKIKKIDSEIDQFFDNLLK